MWRIVRRLAKDSAIYGAANAGTVVLAVLLVPLYTHKLTALEFGRYSLVVMIYGLLSVLADCGLTNSIARYYFDEAQTRDPNTATAYRKSLLTTALVTTACISLLLGIACYGSAGFVSWHAFGAPTYGPLLRIVGVTLLFRGLTTAPMIYLRVTERAVVYGLLSVLQVALFLGFTLLFVLGLDWGVPGILYSQLIATAGWAVCAVVAIARDLSVWPRVSIAKDLLRFGLPFLPALPLMWVVDVSDRYLLERYVSTQEVGLYSLGYRFGQVMVFLVTAVTLAWPSLSYRILGEANAEVIYSKITSLYMAGAGLLWLALSLFSEEMVMLLSPEEFHAAAIYIPPVAFGYLVYGLYVLSVTGLGVAKKIGPLSWVTLVAAVVNVGLNVWLIPRLGALVAAYTTIVGYVILAGGCLLVSQRFYRIPYRYREWAVLLAGMIALCALSRLLPVMPWLTSVVSRLGMLAAYLGLVFVSGVLRRDEMWALAGALSRSAPRTPPVSASSSS
jgi:O-antigen/teichoic acid export membrane protein